MSSIVQLESRLNYGRFKTIPTHFSKAYRHSRKLRFNGRILRKY